MPDYIGNITNAPAARYATLRDAMVSGSPPTLPNCSEVNCDPSEVINTMKVAPVDAHVVTARGRAKVSKTDKHE